ncbi:hypothetical protein QUH73_04940 [Labilibaculum sp. K2S]|uniref:hypothetical protein n=1 Tax=Labilibaculum sp. K2S TaxID=3056386 RepID=UPI0025A3B5AE|nr:hypothetical protein [Labilibaculum sp. K2S]MDM8159162.1 hypothetical protein [Labilibaculum sp. K2S]
MNEELNQLSTEELEYLLGKLNEPEDWAFEQEAMLPPMEIPIHRLEGSYVIGGSGSKLKAPIEIDFDAVRNKGICFFLENKDKMKVLICGNEDIQKEVLKNEKSNTKWLLEKLTESFLKDVDLKKSAMVLAVYLVRIGIKGLCH